ncbi:RNA ligase RtcB family protein [Burkholderiaceae bacterium DAT-1]|nr:RNA ligase RtcB family protein [Burkholderiaceae bacterium DAT-1]
MGNSIQTLSDGVTLIARADTWIEGLAIQQLQHTAALPGMRRVAGMPDLHPGRGHPVGAAFFSTGLIYPALIGSDIGCGMALWQTELEAHSVKLSKLNERLGNLDGPLDEDWLPRIAELLPEAAGYAGALGTIGGGNHFAEIQCLDEIYDAEGVATLGLSKRHLQLLVHSGSRGLGQAILDEHMRLHGHAGLDVASKAARHYLARHDHALAFADANRILIAERMLARLRTSGQRVLDIHHNLMTPATIAGESGWMHRKGATPADQGPVVIPGSRGDYSYLVHPTGTLASLYSLAHGAGRRWMRSECKARVSKRHTHAQLSRTRLGSEVICEDRFLIYEEAPEAYKPIDSVIAAMVDAGVVRVMARLKPVLTYKTRGECCE